MSTECVCVLDVKAT